MRCGTSGTSWHVTVKSSICAWGVLYEGWIRRRLRCYCWKQWGRSGYRELKRRGITTDLAWNTFKSAHGPWRLSQSPVLVYALPTRVFQRMGLPRLANG